MVLHKNKWDRKATRAHERKLRAKAEASGTGAAGGGAKADASRKAVGVGSKPTGPAAGAGKKDEEQQVEEGEGGVKVEMEGEGGVRVEEAGGDEQADGEKGKYSRRKIVDNSWRYEEPEEDPYLKAQEEEDQEPEPDYARMTIGKAQLKDSSDEEHEQDADDYDGRQALDEIFIRDKPPKGPPVKGKIIQADRRDFKDIGEKVAKQKAADAFRQRFALRPQPKVPPPPGSHPVIDFGHDDDGIGDIDEFLGELKLEARAPAQGKTRMLISSGPGKGLRSEEEDDKWLDEMLGSSSARAAAVAKLKSRR
ncbi:hypothetical protein EV426DRAFT_571978 [Tirmania nivea]|nr:hypothetical protein EV426DRAFT_571978 [Tirmania nivea]